jgi:hypothetical protein
MTTEAVTGTLARMEIPKPVVQSRLVLAKHVAHEGIREWFMREDWLLTEREVRMLLTLRRCVAARYYNEWGPVDPEATAVDSVTKNPQAHEGDAG